MGRLLDLKSRVEICLLRSDDRTRPVREALEKLSFATVAPTSNRWPSAVSFDEEGVLEALDPLERLIAIIPISNNSVPTAIVITRTHKNGQFCHRVVDEVRKIRHLYPGSTMVQIRSEHPNCLVWRVVDHPDTDAEDRDIFLHPNQWGPVVEYTIKLLARHFGKSEETIRRWIKAYRRQVRSTGADSQGPANNIPLD